MEKLRITLAQLNATLGDFKGNLKKAKVAVEIAEQRESDLVLLPELFLPGYPPEDLMLKISFLKENRTSLEELALFTEGKEVVTVAGFIDCEEDAYNSAAIIKNGKILDIYRKMSLPNYGVFDERRYFRTGKEMVILKMGEVKIGITICEDIWNPVEPLASLSLGCGIHLVVNISASPYNIGKPLLREKYLSVKSYDYHVAIAYCNMIGGQDELLFDGASIISDANGKILLEGRLFEEEIITEDIDLDKNLRVNLLDPRRRYISTQNLPFRILELAPPKLKKDKYPEKLYNLPQREEEIFKALVTGVRDYVRKNGFKKVVVGLSGGMDSSLVAAIASEALGSENVKGVLMPSPYTSKESVEDALNLARKLRIETLTIPINEVFNSYLEALNQPFQGTAADITEENIQARIRGNYLMALSNKFGWLVLTTGNKSEMATGYATLYGDMAGGLAVIKDVYKTDVYRIGRWYNRRKKEGIIPERVFKKAPSAELKPGQTDQEKLPPYETLDKILKYYIEENLDPEEIRDKGFDKDMVLQVIDMIRKNEYKRRQAPVGIKISTRAFGKDWRMPIINWFAEPASNSFGAFSSKISRKRQS